MGFWDWFRAKEPKDSVRGTPGGRFRYEADGITKYWID